MEPSDFFNGSSSNNNCGQQQQLHFTTLLGRGQLQHQQAAGGDEAAAASAATTAAAAAAAAEIDFDFKILADYLAEEEQYGGGGECCTNWINVKPTHSNMTAAAAAENKHVQLQNFGMTASRPAIFSVRKLPVYTELLTNPGPFFPHTYSYKVYEVVRIIQVQQ